MQTSWVLGEPHNRENIFQFTGKIKLIKKY